MARSAHDIFDVINGYRSSSLVAAAVQIGLIDRLAAGAANVPQLARDLGTDAGGLFRLLRGLAAIEVVQSRGDRVELARLGRALRDEPSARDLAVLTAEEYLPAWGRLRDSVTSGEGAFARMFGQSAWQHRHADADLDERFNRLMTRFQDDAAASIARRFDFSGDALIVDVGGGRGRLLCGILSAHPHLQGVLVDQAHVTGVAGRELSAAGLAERCTVSAGDFFEALPVGGDTYLLRHVLHDWEDADCVRLLTQCRAAMGAAARLLIVETVLPEGMEVSAYQAMIDLHMLVIHGGRERTFAEYEALLTVSGFALAGFTSADGVDVVEAHPRPR